MQIRKINIERPLYGPNKGKFEAQIVVGGEYDTSPAITVPVPEEMLQPIVDIVAQAALATMRAATEMLSSEVAAQLAGPAIEAPALEQQPGVSLPEGDVSI